VATNQNGLQPVEHYALKYIAASVKSENSIFFYAILDFLRYACLSLSFLYPLVFPSSILSVVLSLFSFMFFFFLLFHCILFFMHHFLLFTFLLFILLRSSLRFLHFCFCLLLHLSLHFICFLCSHVYLLKERVCTLSSYASHSCTRSTISNVKE